MSLCIYGHDLKFKYFETLNSQEHVVGLNTGQKLHTLQILYTKIEYQLHIHENVLVVNLS